MEVIAVTALAAVPITHGVAGHRLHKNATNTWRFKNIFFSGGYRFMTFQGFSWSFFVLALVLALGRLFLHVDQMSVVRTHVNERSLLGGSICSALISEVLMVSSLLTYHRGHHARPGQGHRRTPSANVTSAADERNSYYHLVVLHSGLGRFRASDDGASLPSEISNRAAYVCCPSPVLFCHRCPGDARGWRST